MTEGQVARTIGDTLDALHDLDALTHAVQWFEDARVRADAARLDHEAGRTPVLLGIPVTVKDWIDVEGFPCAGGTSGHAHRRPTTDATVIARLRAAGAVVVAKTKPWNGIGGGPPVTHPVDPERAPGGSSSGEGVTTAAGVVPLGVGSDSGGSVRLPAAWCGVFGHKPTAGLVPTTGHFHRVGPASDGRTQIGLLGSDLLLIETALGVIAGADGQDAGVAPVPFVAHTGSVAGRSYAVLPDDPDHPVTPPVADAVTRAVARFEAAGMERRPWGWSWLGQALDVTERYWNRVALSGAEVELQLWDWDRFRRRALVELADVDVLVAPAVADVAPPHRAIGAEDFVFLLPASLTGSPALSVPMGVDASGLPVAVQLVGRPWDDATVLAVARTLT